MVAPVGASPRRELIPYPAVKAPRLQVACSVQSIHGPKLKCHLPVWQPLLHRAEEAEVEPLIPFSADLLVAANAGR